MSLSRDIEARLRARGFEQVGFADLRVPLTIGVYEEWLNAEHHGEMNYLRRHLEDKRDPSRLLRKAQSAIVVTKNYVPHPKPRDFSLPSLLPIVARYARGDDYHHFLKAELEGAIRDLRERYPQEDFVCFTDSSPVLERDLAYRAGLGWVGKNTCLISKTEGSLFFIGEIFTTLKSEAEATFAHDHCGTCTRCLDACPTGALTAPRKLDARLCISYLTIESRKIPPAPLREKIGEWLFGCDICQTVCPWNLKIERTRAPALDDPPSDRRGAIEDLRFLLTNSGRRLEKTFRGTPLARAGSFGLKRNAILVACQMQALELRGEIETYLDHPKLGELAAWALKRLSI